MRVVIPGGSGQVGTLLARAFYADGHDVVVVSRRPSPQPWRVVAWDGVTLGAWQRDVDGSDAHATRRPRPRRERSCSDPR